MKDKTFLKRKDDADGIAAFAEEALKERIRSTPMNTKVCICSASLKARKGR